MGDPPAWGWAWLAICHCKKFSLSQNGVQGLGLGEILGTTQVMENGHEIWYMKCKESLGVRFIDISCKRNSKVYVRVSGSTGGQMG
jgi:hypothetical protein